MDARPRPASRRITKWLSLFAGLTLAAIGAVSWSLDHVTMTPAGRLALAMIPVALWGAAILFLVLTVRGLEFGRPSTDPRRPLAMFPDLTFLQLLFGFRALEELAAAFPDCVVRTQEARALLTALFPRTPSDVWPVG